MVVDLDFVGFKDFRGGGEIRKFSFVGLEKGRVDVEYLVSKVYCGV